MKFRSLLLHSALYGVAEVVARLVQTVVVLWLARRCTKEEYGDVGFLIAAQQAVVLLATGGVVEAVTSKITTARQAGNEPGSLFASAVSLTGLSGLVVSSVFIPGVVLWSRGRMVDAGVWVVVSVAASGVVSAGLSVLASLHRLEEAHRRAVALKVVPLLFSSSAGMLGAFLTHRHALGFFAGSAIGQLVASALFWRSLYPWKATRPRWLDIRAMWRTAVPFVMLGVFGWLSGYGNNVIIRSILGQVDVAEYTVVINIAFVITLAVNTFSQVWSPRFFRLAVDAREHLDELNSLVARFQLLAIAALSGVLVLLTPVALRFIGRGGAVYGDLQPYVTVILSGYVLLTFYYRCSNYYLLHDAGGMFTRLMIIGSVLGLGLTIGGIELVGRWGIYVGFVATMALRSGLTFWYAARRWSVPGALWEVAGGLALVLAAFGLSRRTTLPVSLVSFALVMAAATVGLTVASRSQIATLRGMGSS